MISRSRAQEIRECAWKIVTESKFSELPVDPKRIAKKFRIELKPFKPSKPGISGFFMRVGVNFGIGYSTAIKNKGFVNFTTAHELGHFFLDGHAELLEKKIAWHFSSSGFVSNDKHEREADLFAAELLMPEPFFRKAISTLPPRNMGFAAIQHLAELGRTSLVATAISFAKFTDVPAAVIFSSGSRVESCFLSPGFCLFPGVERLRKNCVVPTHTGTAKFNKTATQALTRRRTQNTCSLRSWFERAPNVRIQEEVIGLGGYEKTLTVLHTNGSQSVSD